MSLSLQATERLFERLIATYGSEFLNKYPGNEEEIRKVKTVWAHELGDFQSSLSRIAWALENLPERCPNVIAFKNLCRLAPSPEVPELPAPKADPERLRAEIAKLTSKISAQPAEQKDCRAWARKILAEKAAGIPRTPAVVQMAKNALGAA